MRYNSHIRDFMARLRNTFANAIQDEIILPRAIVIILEDDMIDYVNVDGFGISLAYGKLLHYLFSEFNKMIAAHKDQLPLRAKRQHFPELLWINPYFHSSFNNNGQRNKFTKAMDTTAAIYADNWSLQLKHIWDPQNREIYLDHACRFSSKGLMTYWMAVDHTIQFWETALSPVHKKKQSKSTFFPGRGKQRTNKFSWRKDNEF